MTPGCCFSGDTELSLRFRLLVAPMRQTKACRMVLSFDSSACLAASRLSSTVEPQVAVSTFVTWACDETSSGTFA